MVAAAAAATVANPNAGGSNFMANIKIRFFVTLPLYPRILWHAVGMSMSSGGEGRRGGVASA